MNTKEETHRKQMAFLDNYLTHTPKDIIKKEIKEISDMNYEGISALDYFKNFSNNRTNIPKKQKRNK